MDRRPFNIIKKITLVCVVVVLSLFALQLIPGIISENNKIILNASTWNSSQSPLDDNDEFLSTKYVDINTLFIGDGSDVTINALSSEDVNAFTNGTKVIMLNNGLDVYYFSLLCDNDDRFLSFHYCLGSDIDYEDASKINRMFRPVGYLDSKPFTGVFDGRGYTISNIFFFIIDDENLIDTSMQYISFISINEGTIKNLGIINPNLLQYDLYYDGICLVSPLCSKNDGIIENCYVQDLRSDAGMTAEGGYISSMFVNVNNGSIKNSYVATKRITSSSVTFVDGTNHPFVNFNNNNGMMSNCYFDNEIINRTCSDGETDPTLKGLDGITTNEFTGNSCDVKFNHIDPNSQDQKYLWFSNYTYDLAYKRELNLVYPILKGFNVSNGYFEITNTDDFVYMFDLCNKYGSFRSAKYKLMANVNMDDVSEGHYGFGQTVFSGEFVGNRNGDFDKVKLANGTYSNIPTIFNYTIEEGVSYNGYHAYGVFGILSGTVKDVNFVNINVNQKDLNNNTNYDEINAVGTVCGLLEDGIIENVHVSGSILPTDNIDTKSGSFLGTEYIGGICGVGTSGVITKCTTAGLITTTNFTNFDNNDYNMSIGGILGKAQGVEEVSKSLNSMVINNISYSKNPTNYKQFIGGVIGSGEINNTYELQNNGVINVNNGTFYSTVYVGGIIGKVGNATGSNGVYLNNANINYVVNENNYKAYISGVMNVISDAADKYDRFTYTASENQTSIQKELENQNPFEFTSLSNGGLLNITNNLASSKYPAKYNIINNVTVTNGIDIRAAGICYSYLTNFNVFGAYNLDYHFSTSENIRETNVPQTIDVSMIDEYAPTFNADNKVTVETQGNQRVLGLDTNYLSNTKTVVKTSVNLERVYNYNDINYITNKEVLSYMMQLSGCINGRNFNLKNIRNDGDIKVYFTDDASELNYRHANYSTYFADHKKLKIFGVMEEVSIGYRAEDIYNGGNITFSSPSDIAPNYNLYIAGICYKNVGNDDTSNQNLLLDRGYQGSLHNCVNNGTIRTTNGNILTNDNLVAPCKVYGYSRIGGITCINSSTISQTFNLGDLYNVVAIQRPTGSSNVNHPQDGHFEVETGGICFIMQNEEYDNQNHTTSANIIDSANNGTVIAMNTSNDSAVGGNGKGFTNAGGFVARNDRGEDGYRIDQDESTVQNSHLSKIQYSINYGDVYAYNNVVNVQYTNEQQSKAAGFVCLGACTIVDTINYGNIYGNSVASGIFGYLYVNRMRGLGPSSPIYIANSINYGKVKILQKTTNNENNIPNIGSNGAKPEVHATVPSGTSNSTTIYTAGALIGVWHTTNPQPNDLDSMKIKYLVNFVDDLNMLGTGTNYTNINTGMRDMLLNMATTNPNDTSPVPFQTDRTNYQYGIKSYYKDASEGNGDLTNIYSQDHNGGIFNEKYSLRNPGELTYLPDGVTVDPNETDNFIADYIQFIPYSKVNDYLVEKIGLKDAVEAEAVKAAYSSYNAINGFLNGIKSDSESSTIFNDLVASESAKLQSLKDSIIENIAFYLRTGDYTEDELKDILALLLQDSQAKNGVLNDEDVIRILNKVIENLDETSVNSFINIILDTTSNDILASIVKNNSDLFNDYIESYATNPSAEQTQRLISLYNVISINQNALYSYANSLSQNDINTLNSSLTSLGLSSNVNALSDAQVNNAILNMSEQDFRNMVTDLMNQAGSNSNMRNFLESGRSNNSVTNIYLPATKGKHLALVNNNYVVQTANNNSPNTTNGTNIYTGTHYKNENGQYISGGEKSNEIYVAEGSFRFTYNARNSYRYYYWTLDNNKFTINMTNSDNRPNGTVYNVVYYGKTNSNNTFGRAQTNAGASVNTHTGVFADIIANSSVTYRQNNNNNNTDFDYENITYSQYIDYSNNNNQKLNININQSMMIAMDYALENKLNTIDECKNYIINIYNAAADNRKTQFINEYLNDEISKLKVVDMLNKLSNNNTTNGNNLKLDIVNDIYLEGSALLTNNEINQITPIIKDIFENEVTTYAQKKEFLLNSSSQFGFILMDNLIPYDNVNDSLLSKTDYITLIRELLNEDINLLNTYKYDLSTLFNKDIKDLVSAYLIVGNETKLVELFKSYDINNDNKLDLEEIKALCESAGTDYAILTDSTGIYALASSHGIENGLFLPDNISLIELDPKVGEHDINDPSWRGGTPEDPDFFDPDDAKSRKTVNYKVYYTMKQLKKSIATTVFKIELVDKPKGELHDYEMVNDIEVDYDMENKKIYFYIPINHDILKGNALYINMNQSENGEYHYELAYKATFINPDEPLKIEFDNTTLGVGDKLNGYFGVQAEDVKVTSEYEVIVTIAKPGYLSSINSIITDGNNSAITRYESTQSFTSGTYSYNMYRVGAISGNSVNGYNGNIRVQFGTYNLKNELDLTSNLSIYKVNSNVVSQYSDFETLCLEENILTLDEDYSFDATDNNGIVVSNSSDYNITDNTYPSGIVTFGINLGNYLTKGYYIIRVEISENAVYYVLFEKAPSDRALVEELIYLEDGFVNTNSVNTYTTTIKYGTVLTETNFINTSNDLLANSENGIPMYLTDLLISPLATYSMGDVVVTENNGLKTYEVPFIITAEDGSTNTFIHRLTEETYSILINAIYLDGRVEYKYNEEEQISAYVSEFEKYENPSYRIEYLLDAFYTTSDSAFFSVTDGNGGLITDDLNIGVTVNEGKGFILNFYNDVLSDTYTFNLVYSNSVQFNESTTLNWNVTFDDVTITKIKNKDSYLENITFISDTIITSLNTKLDIKAIDFDSIENNKPLPSEDSPIVVLPSKIHYNDYSYEINKQDVFYVIGLVNKTETSWYAPTFSLPEDAVVYRVKEIGDVLYRYVPYTYTENGELQTINYLISEDGTKVLDVDGNAVKIPNNHVISDDAGKPGNSSLYTDFSLEGSYVEDEYTPEEGDGEFGTVDYRVYSEIYDVVDYNTNEYYTDYRVSVHDMTNNIKFKIIVQREDDSNVNTVLESVYVELICHNDFDDSTFGPDSEYDTDPAYNRLGFYSYFDGDKLQLYQDNNNFKSNTAGRYEVFASLPVGYTFDVTIEDGGTTTVDKSHNFAFVVKSSIRTRTIGLTITIKNSSDHYDWGVHVQESPTYKD